jgi:hypothetical protein
MQVRPGKQEIPFPYVLDGLELGDVSPTELSKYGSLQPNSPTLATKRLTGC